MIGTGGEEMGGEELKIVIKDDKKRNCSVKDS